MELVKSVIHRMDIWNVLAVGVFIIIMTGIIGGFSVAKGNRDANTQMVTSIVEGCKGNADFVKCVSEASEAAGLKDDAKLRLQQDILSKCFSYNSGDAQERCVRELTAAVK